MNYYFLSAAILAFVVGLMHTILGERMIFRRMRRDGFIPTEGGQLLQERHVRILWASWHVLTVFGWGMATLLVWLARQSSSGNAFPVIENTISISMLVGAVLVLVGTKAKHPGWIGLLGVAALVWFSRTT